MKIRDIIKRKSRGKTKITSKASDGQSTGLLSLVRADFSRQDIQQDIVRLLQSGADVNMCDDEGATPLMLALASQNVPIVKLLLSAGADPAPRADDGVTAIMLAAGFINGAFATETLLRAGANVNVQDNAGRTPLMYAARKNSLDVLSVLLDAGADLTVKDHAGRTALDYLAMNQSLRNNVDAEKLLTPVMPVSTVMTAAAATAVPVAPTVTPVPISKYANIFAAAKDGDVDDISGMLAEGADVNLCTQNGWTPLMFAAGYNKPEIVAALLSAGADVESHDQNGWTPLLTAARMSKFPEVIKLLTSAEADPTAKTVKGNTVLMMLSQNPNLKDNTEVRNLLTKLLTPAQPHAQPRNIIIAAKDGSPDEIKELLARGANVNICTQNGWTPLMFAAGYNKPEVVAALLSAGADLESHDQNGWTPLLTAARMSKFPDVIKLLIAAGADPTAKTAKGNTILMMLSQNPNLKNLQDDVLDELKAVIKNLLAASQLNMHDLQGSKGGN